MIDEKYYLYDSRFDGHRFRFNVHGNGTAVMEDEQEEFQPVPMDKDCAYILAKMLNDQQEYRRRDKENLIILHSILDFIKENKDIDKDIMLALINNIGGLIKNE